MLQEVVEESNTDIDEISVNLSTLDTSLSIVANNVESAVVTAIGADQAGAAAITVGVNIVAGADNTVGVVFPAVAVGKTITIYNIDTTVTATKKLVLYPAVGEYINALAINTATNINHASGSTVSKVVCVYQSVDKWTVTAITGVLS
jgi:hypothetical protein